MSNRARSETPANAVDVQIRHRLGSLELEVRFAVTAPWTVLFGPSGSGKSTILRIIAGLARPDEGVVQVMGQTVVGEGTWVPAHRRAVRWAGQRAALFPRMTVKANLAQACADQGHEAPDHCEFAINHFGLREIQNSLPGELSGGQRQRVSVVRAAMGARGKVLLLDEPFAGLDAGVREELIGQLRGWIGSSPIVSVTHDVGEAFLLGAEVVRVAGGRVVGQGPVEVILGAERDRLREVLGNPTV